MNQFILRYFKLLNKLFGNYRWFQILLKGTLNERANILSVTTR